MGTAYASRIFTQSPPRSECPNCGFAAWLSPALLQPGELQEFNSHVVHCRHIKQKDYVHHAGAALVSLYVLHSGFLKTIITDGDGNLQITGFSMRGEMVGLDAIGSGQHQCDTIALEDSYLCGIAYSDFEQLTNDMPMLRRHFHRALGKEIARDYGIMFLLGGMRADERIAIFLLNLAKRFAARGGSATHFRLPMKRREIGSFLGLKVETVSRVLSHFDQLDVIAIDGKEIEIKSSERLNRITRRDEPCLPRRSFAH